MHRNEAMIARLRTVRKCWFISACVLFAGAFLCQALDLKLNTTPSIPLGLYMRTSDPGGYAVFCPQGDIVSVANERGYRSAGSCPDGFVPLVKPIVARVGDVVTLNAFGIAVNGELLPNTTPLHLDSKGRVLNSFPYGVYAVKSGEIWVASSYNVASFDSRYLGPVATNSVRELVKPILVWR